MTRTEQRSSRVVGRQVKRLRGRQGISATRLAERCAELGAGHMTRSVIANIESRRDAVSVDELLVISCALNVPATLLLAPVGSEEVVEVAPNIVIHPHLLLDWLTGEAPLADSDQFARVQPWKADGAPMWRDAALPIWFFQKLRRHQSETSLAWGRLSGATERDEGVDEAQQRYDMAVRALFQHLEVMERSGYKVPEPAEPYRARFAELEAEEG